MTQGILGERVRGTRRLQREGWDFLCDLKLLNDHAFTNFFLSLLKYSMHSAGDAQRREDNGWEHPLFLGARTALESTQGPLALLCPREKEGLQGGGWTGTFFKQGKS